MRKMKLLACVLCLAFAMTGCGLDSLPPVFDVEQGGADFDSGSLELPPISLEDIKLPELSFEKFDLKQFLSGEFKLPEITLKDFLKAYGSKADELTEEQKDSQYKEYLTELWKEMLCNQEGIKDIDLNFEEITGGEKLNVDIDFDSLVGDKEAIKEQITQALEKFFADYEGLIIEVEEE